MANCPAITGKGTPCKGLVKHGNEFCPAHDPRRAQDRRRVASIAGKGNTKQGGEIAKVKADLRRLMDDVVEGRADKGRVSVAAQVAGVLCRYHELERRIKETEEFEARLEALEMQSLKKTNLKGA